MEGQRHTTKNLNRGKWCLGGHTGPATREFQSTASPLSQTGVSPYNCLCLPAYTIASGLDYINAQGDYVVSYILIAVMTDANMNWN